MLYIVIKAFSRYITNIGSSIPIPLAAGGILHVPTTQSDAKPSNITIDPVTLNSAVEWLEIHGAGFLHRVATILTIIMDR